VSELQGRDAWVTHVGYPFRAERRFLLATRHLELDASVCGVISEVRRTSTERQVLHEGGVPRCTPACCTHPPGTRSIIQY
jgi:hypothetical protein